MENSLLELQDVVVAYRTEPTGPFGLWGAKPIRALDRVSLVLRKGETLGIMGGSGGGKSTLAEVATLRRSTDRGRILIDGMDITKSKGAERKRLRRRFQIVRQDARESLEMDRTVRKSMQDLMRLYNLPDGDGRMARALAEVELDESFLNRTPGQMSGGQQQRLAIARALALSPAMIAADEPVSGVDPQLRTHLLDLLANVQRERQMSYLLISQDPKVISRLAHRTAIMDAGRLYEVAPTEQILSSAKHPYSRLFLGQDQGHLPADEDLSVRVSTGCPFAGHCPVAIDICRVEAPILRAVAPGHTAACHAL